MEPLSCPERRPIQLRILLYFSTNGTLGADFGDPPVPSVPLSQMSTNILFYQRLYAQDWDSVLDRVSQCPKLLTFP